MFLTFKLRPKLSADRLLCLAVVLVETSSSSSASEPDFLGLVWPVEPLHTPLRARARARIPHHASPLFPAPQPLQPREALLAAAACPAAYQGPASA
eukprot:355184-Chlamydomonas_euryale.AAC.3